MLIIPVVLRLSWASDTEKMQLSTRVQLVSQNVVVLIANCNNDLVKQSNMKGKMKLNLRLPPLQTGSSIYETMHPENGKALAKYTFQ